MEVTNVNQILVKFVTNMAWETWHGQVSRTIKLSHTKYAPYVI